MTDDHDYQSLSDASDISEPPTSDLQDLTTTLSPSSLPELSILPHPLAADRVVVGQLVSKSSKHNPTSLEHRDYDDIGSRFYKDVVLIDSSSGNFTSSLGGILYVNEKEKPEKGTDVGTIEAREMKLRMLKDPASALSKVLSDIDTKNWVICQAAKGEELGFVTAVREVVNASYRHAGLVDRGAGNWEVVRDVGAAEKGGKKRRDSGLDVSTGSKVDVVGVKVQRVMVQDGEARLVEEEMGGRFWK